jgi:hypothetical protein
VKSPWLVPDRIVRALAACALACVLLHSPARGADPPATPAEAAAPAEPSLGKKEEAKADKKAAREKKKAAKLEKMAAEDKQDLESKSPWTRNANWLSLRVGTARSYAKYAPAASFGAGFGTYHFLNRRWAAGLHADVNVLGKFAGSTEIDAPIAVEMSRHFHWSETLRPYLGAGTGAFFHKTYRTGGDQASMRPGIFFSGGMNTPVSARSLLGLDVRMTVQTSARSADPVFPNEGKSATMLTFKLNYLRWL